MKSKKPNLKRISITLKDQSLHTFCDVKQVKDVYSLHNGDQLFIDSDIGKSYINWSDILVLHSYY